MPTFHIEALLLLNNITSIFQIFQPTYSYQYQVADDSKQTYITHDENRDGDVVTGEYSYVDPLGQLVTVTYSAGAEGYTETREVTPNKKIKKKMRTSYKYRP